MRLVLTGGGTAGHINPALSVGGYMRDNAMLSDILFIGNEDKMEAKIVPAAKIKFAGIKISGLKRSVSPKSIVANTAALVRLLSARKKCKKLLRDFKADLVFSTGGYVSLPVVMAAFSLNIPVVLHESNSFPGIATKYLAKKADKVLLASEDAKARIRQAKYMAVTGNPINESILSADRLAARNKFALSEEDVCILSFGGSLGAETINRLAAKAMAFSKADKRIKFIHAMGSFYIEDFPRFLEEAGVDIKSENLHISEYINNMPECLAACDIVLSRAGSITINEIRAAGKAAVLIPSPNVTENHQYYNALTLEKLGAAFVCEEKDLTDAWLLEKIEFLVNHKSARDEMGQKARDSAVLNANERIAKEILELVFKKVGETDGR